MLSDIKILDLTSNLPGPYATTLLCDLGAEVLKIERPPKGDPARRTLGSGRAGSPRFTAVNRGKRSLTLNLKTEAAKEIFIKLLDRYDTVIEGFRPGVMDRLGLGYQVLRKRRPDLIYVAVTGFGQDGPLADRAGHDVTYQALAGTAILNGGPDGRPTLPGFQAADLAGGSAMAVIGLLAAVRRRDKTGRGAFVDVSMLDGLFSMASFSLAAVLGGEDGGRAGQGLLTGALPCYQIYRTADGRFMALGALEPHFWERFCRAIGREDLIDQAAGGRAVIEEVAGIMAARTQAEWVEIFAGVDCCCEPVLTPQEAVAAPQAVHRRLARWVESDGERHFTAGCPIRFDDHEPRPPAPAPDLGEANEAVLKDLGYSEDEIAALKTAGVI